MNVAYTAMFAAQPLPLRPCELQPNQLYGLNLELDNLETVSDVPVIVESVRKPRVFGLSSLVQVRFSLLDEKLDSVKAGSQQPEDTKAWFFEPNGRIHTRRSRSPVRITAIEDVEFIDSVVAAHFSKVSTT